MPKLKPTCPRKTKTAASPTSRMLCKLYPPGCLPTFWLLTLQKLNFSSLDSNNNLLKLTPAHLTQYTLLVILALFLMNILLFLTRYLLFLNPATKSCYRQMQQSWQICISQLCCICPYLDFKTASTINYCNSLYLRPTWILTKPSTTPPNSQADAVVRTPKSSHITPSLQCFHCSKLKNE